MSFGVIWCVIERHIYPQATRILVSENALLAVVERAFLMAELHWTIEFNKKVSVLHHDNVSLRSLFVNRDEIVLRQRGRSLLSVHVNLSKIKNNHVSAIRFSTLAGICEALECQPGDVLKYVSGSNV